MKIGILGTGTVGTTIGSKLVQRGHDVKLGGRTSNNEKAAAWVSSTGTRASQGAFADAAAFGEVLFLCTAGHGALDALKAAGESNVGQKIVIDVTNPLDTSKGMPPSLFVSGTDSLGEQLQRAMPKAKIVKSLNTINCSVMVDPQAVGGGAHDVFVCGNDAGAKARVSDELLRGAFGWKHVIDLGDITGARAAEAYVLFWVRMYGALGSGSFNVHVVR
jgi:predicted dinucleotide-binding enzyme